MINKTCEELICSARMFDLRHEYEHGILGCDWDSPEEFARRFHVSYHNEELFFGGQAICAALPTSRKKYVRR